MLSYCLILCLLLVHAVLNSGIDSQNDFGAPMGMGEPGLTAEERKNKIQEVINSFAEDGIFSISYKPKAKTWYLEPKCFRKLGHTTCYNISKESPVQCLGANIHFDSVGSLINNEIPDFRLVSEKYKNYAGAAKCWDSFVNVLCSVYASPCNHTHHNIRLIPQSICLNALRSCTFLAQENLWPSILGNCTDPKVFATDCELWDAKRESYLTGDESVCYPPLVSSSIEEAWLVPGCALNCTNPFIKPHMQRNLVTVVGFVAIVAFVLSLLTFVNIMLTSRSLSPHSHGITAVLFFFMVMCACWIPALSSRAHKHLHCREDGSLLFYDQTHEELFTWCTFQFFVLYMCILCCCGLLLMFCFDLFMYSLSETSEFELIISYKKSYWWLVTITIAIVLVIIALATFQVDSDGMIGVCFIGYRRPVMRLYFVHIPLIITLFVCWAMLIASAKVQWSHRKASDLKQRTSNEANSSRIMPTCILLLFLSLSVIGSGIIHVIENIIPLETKKHSIVNSIVCQMRSPTEFARPSDCAVQFQHDFGLLIMDVLLCQLILPGSAINIYLWTCSGMEVATCFKWILNILAKAPCLKFIFNKLQLKKDGNKEERGNCGELGTVTMGLLEESTLSEGKTHKDNSELSCSEDSSNEKPLKSVFNDNLDKSRRHRWSEKQIARGRRSRTSSTRGSNQRLNQATPNSLASSDLPPHLRLSSSADSFTHMSNASPSQEPDLHQLLVNASYYKGVAESMFGMLNSPMNMAAMMHTPMFNPSLHTSPLNSNADVQSPQGNGAEQVNPLQGGLPATTPAPNESVSSMGQYPLGVNPFWMHQQVMMMMNMNMMQQRNGNSSMNEGKTSKEDQKEQIKMKSKRDSSSSAGTSATESARTRRRRKKPNSRNSSRQASQSSNVNNRNSALNEDALRAAKNAEVSSNTSSDFDVQYKHESTEEFVGNESDFDPEEEALIMQKLQANKAK